MNKRIVMWWISVFFALFALGCSTTTPVKEEAPVKLIDGYIVAIDQNGHKVLVTEQWKGTEQQQPGAAWVTIKEETEILNQKQQNISFQDLRKGWVVEVWNKGAVAESYPVQAGAAKLIVKSNGDDSAAISRSITYLNDSDLKFIQQAAFDEAKGVWVVKIAKLGSTHTLYVNVKTGEVLDHWKPKPQKPSQPKPKPTPKPNPKPTPSTPKIVMQNDAFRIFEPAPNSKVGKTLTVKGEARVFEAVLSYSLEDGHNVLAKGHVQASKGAPEWGSFEIKITVDQATSPTGVLSIYEESAKDGSPRNVLNIPVTFKDEVIHP